MEIIPPKKLNNPRLREVSKKTQFKKGNIPKNRKGGESPNKPYSIRHELRILLAGDVSDLISLQKTLEGIIREGKKGKCRVAKVVAARMIEKVIKKGEGRLIQSLIDNAEGKLKLEIDIPNAQQDFRKFGSLEEAAAAYRELSKL